MNIHRFGLDLCDQHTVSFLYGSRCALILFPELVYMTQKSPKLCHHISGRNGAIEIPLEPLCFQNSHEDKTIDSLSHDYVTICLNILSFQTKLVCIFVLWRYWCILHMYKHSWDTGTIFSLALLSFHDLPWSWEEILKNLQWKSYNSEFYPSVSGCLVLL